MSLQQQFQQNNGGQNANFNQGGAPRPYPQQQMQSSHSQFTQQRQQQPLGPMRQQPTQAGQSRPVEPDYKTVASNYRHARGGAYDTKLFETYTQARTTATWSVDGMLSDAVKVLCRSLNRLTGDTINDGMVTFVAELMERFDPVFVVLGMNFPNFNGSRKQAIEQKMQEVSTAFNINGADLFIQMFTGALDYVLNQRNVGNKQITDRGKKPLEVLCYVAAKKQAAIGVQVSGNNVTMLQQMYLTNLTVEQNTPLIAQSLKVNPGDDTLLLDLGMTAGDALVLSVLSHCAIARANGVNILGDIFPNVMSNDLDVMKRYCSFVDEATATNARRTALRPEARPQMNMSGLQFGGAGFGSYNQQPQSQQMRPQQNSYQQFQQPQQQTQQTTEESAIDTSQ